MIAMLVAALFSAGCVPPAPAADPRAVESSPVLMMPGSSLLSKPSGTPPMAGSRAAERIGRRIVVRMRSVGCGGLGTASGFVLDETLLVTNRHVVEDAVVLELNTWDGKSVNAVLTAVAYADDLAVVRVAEPLPVSGRLAATDASAGERVTVVGYPHGGPLLESTGELIEYAPLEGRQAASEVMRLSAIVQPGNSGGPVLAADGSVVGVVFGTEPATGNGLAIPASAVRRMLEESRPPAAPTTC